MVVLLRYDMIAAEFVHEILVGNVFGQNVVFFCWFEGTGCQNDFVSLVDQPLEVDGWVQAEVLERSSLVSFDDKFTICGIQRQDPDELLDLIKNRTGKGKNLVTFICILLHEAIQFFDEVGFIKK